VKWSVSISADGDRELTHEEIVELADAVAIHSGIASGIGTSTYGAQLIVEATDEDDAIAKGTDLFAAAAAQAGLPPWPVTHTEAISEASEEATQVAAEAASDYVEFR
jgi:hypothetical protein